MTKSFDYSEFDVRDMVYEYGNLTPAEADEKKRLLEQFQKEKEALKAAAQATPKVETTDMPAAPRPAFRPTKPSGTPLPESDVPGESAAKMEESLAKKASPPFRPSMKPKTDQPLTTQESAAEVPSAPRPKPVFKPSMKPKTDKPVEIDDEAAKVPPLDKPKPAFRPTMRPPIAKQAAPEMLMDQPAETENEAAKVPPLDNPKPAFRPTMKPPMAEPAEEKTEVEKKSEEPTAQEKPKPAFRPTMKPRIVPPPKPSEE